MKLSLKSFSINKDNWYYENKKGIEVIHYGRDANGKIVCQKVFIIPWRKIENSYKRWKQT